MGTEMFWKEAGKASTGDLSVRRLLEGEIPTGTTFKARIAIRIIIGTSVDQQQVQG